MSAIVVGNYFEIKVNVKDDKKLVNFETDLINCLDSKLEKLNLIFKQMKLYESNNLLLVHDKFNSCLELETILESFGMKFIKIKENNLKGNLYLVDDTIRQLLDLLGHKYDWNKVLKLGSIDINLDEKTLNSLKDERINKFDKEKLLDFIKQIKEKGFISAEGRDYYMDGQYVKTVSSEKEIQEALESYVSMVKEEVSNINENLKNGTVELLCNRAKQMGYNIKKSNNGKEVELVLTRIE